MTTHESISGVVEQRCVNLMDHLRKYPQTFDMRRYYVRVKVDEAHPCGSIGCLAGTLVFLEDGPWDEDDICNTPRRAEELLEIGPSAGATFWYVSDWPEHLQKRHANEDSIAVWEEFTADDGIDRIQHFLETGT